MIKDINDYLVSMGLPKLSRSLTKSTMAVKHFHETKWNNKIQPYPCYALEKIDGINCILLNVNHNYMCFTREGKRMKNMERFEQYYNENKFPVLVNSMVNCEIANYHFSLEELGAVVKSTRKKELTGTEEFYHKSTYLVAFDQVDLDEFLKGEDKCPFNVRWEIIKADLSKCKFILPDSCLCETELQTAEFFERMVAKHKGEGIVQVLPDSPWVAGYKNHYKTKKVRGVDYDLEVIDIEEGKGKRAGMVANLVVRWRNYGLHCNPIERLSVDGRFTDDMRIAWFKDPSSIIGSIVHVHALQMGSQGSLRLAKVHEVRIDKTEADL